MKKILPGLLRGSRWALVMVVLAALPGCLAEQNFAGAKNNGGGMSVQQKAGTPIDSSHPYVYNLPHQVPDDYVYRTERIFAAPGQPPFPPGRMSSAAGGKPQPTTASSGKKFAVQLVQRVHQLVSQLLGASNGGLEEDQRVLVSSFVNLNDLYKTSALGRMLGEQMVSELQRAGIEVVDVRKTPDMLIQQKMGEFDLSRDMEELPYVHKAYATVVGTYSEADGQLFVNARILRNRDGLVMASASTVLEKNALLSSLLEDEAEPADRRLDTVQMEVQ